MDLCLCMCVCGYGIRENMREEGKKREEEFVCHWKGRMTSDEVDGRDIVDGECLSVSNQLSTVCSCWM